MIPKRYSMMYTLNNVIIVCVLVLSVINYATCRTYNDPPYDWEYLEEDCQPYYANDTGEDWNERVKNLTDGESRLYGYVQPSDSGVYNGPLNCAIKVVAPPGYRLVVRIPRIELYHDATDCVFDHLSVIGANVAVLVCGYGSVDYSVYSLSNWLIFAMKASYWDTDHGYIGFQLYYTAVHYDTDGWCNTEGPNATEFRCHEMGWCTPSDVVCDVRDNCGYWEEETTSVCGLTSAAIITISVLCSAVGLCLIAGGVYLVYSHQQKKKHRERQRTLAATGAVQYSANDGRGMVTMAGIPGMGGGMSGGLGEPPPPYTTTPYINYGHNPEDSPYDTIGEPALASGTTAGAVVPVSEKSGLPPEYSPDNASANISHPGEHPGGLMNTPISANPGMPGMTSGQAE